MALRVDPVFTGELCRLCGVAVWEEVGASVGARLRQLYAAPSYRHIGLAGMLATGFADFKDVIEPMLASDNSQERLGIYRTWDDFHVSTLGADWRGTVKGWSEHARVSFVSELLNRGNLQDVIGFARATQAIRSCRLRSIA